MANQGYVIAKSPKTAQYFTARSSYDRPSWISLEEATVYPTAELAQASITKLFKKGSFNAAVIALSELALPMTSIPPMSVQSSEQTGSDIDVPHGGNDDMIADDQEEVCGSCDHEPCTCDDHESDDTMSIDGQEVTLKVESVETEQIDEAGIPTTVHMVPINDPAMVVDPDKDAGTNVADDHEAKIKVPAAVRSALNKALGEFNKCSDPATTRDDIRSSHCMTVAAAIQTLIDDLDHGTVEGLKMAQVHLTSFMSPIANNVPAIAAKFITSGGARMSLKDMYNDSWAEKRQVVLNDN